MPRESAPLDLDVPDSVMDFTSSAIPIVAGETYGIFVAVRSCAGLLRATGNVYDGGEEIIGGAAHPESDLAFRVLVR